MCLPLWLMVYFCQVQVIKFTPQIRIMFQECAAMVVIHTHARIKKTFIFFFFLFSFWSLLKSFLIIFINCIGVTHGLLSHSVYPNLCCCSFKQVYIYIIYIAHLPLLAQKCNLSYSFVHFWGGHLNMQ